MPLDDQTPKPKPTPEQLGQRVDQLLRDLMGIANDAGSIGLRVDFKIIDRIDRAADGTATLLSDYVIRLVHQVHPK